MAVKTRLFQSFLLPIALSLSACAADLGVFEKEDGYESYYEAFGDVTGLYDGGNHSYDIEKSLFNATTVEEGKWTKEEYEVKKEAYVYLILPFEEALNIESLSLSFQSPVDMDIEISLFYFLNESQAPQNIKYLSSPDTKPITDEDGNVIGEEVIEYDDPPISSSILRGQVSLGAGAWSAVGMGGFKQPGYTDGNLHTGDDGLLYIRIENNSGWNKTRLTSVQVTFINLLVRGV